MEKEGIKIIANNKKASYEYFLSDFLECGIVLQGTEIKSLRVNGASLSDSYVIIRNGEMFILGMNIAQYDKGNIFNHEPTRTRKLLLHKEEIEKYNRKVQEKGFTIMASKIYFRNGKAKVEIALAKGKKLYDKREVEKNKSINREIDSHLKMKNQY
jgi:ssrA-binding protein